jgi:hypothetical protein
LKILQGKNRDNSGDIGIGNYFLNRTVIVQDIRARLDKWDESNLNFSAHQKKQLPESRDNPLNGREIFTT